MKRLAVGFTTFVFVLCAAFVAQAENGNGDQYFDSNGVKIRYFVKGEGEPLLLIHGYSATAEQNWGALIGPLSQDYQVIGIDNRGHGKSEKPLDADMYGQEMVRDSIRLLDHLGIEKAHVAGYSMGAIITGKMLTTHPERMQTAMLGGAGWLQNDELSLTLTNELADSLEENGDMGPLMRFLTPEGQPEPTQETIDGFNAMIMLNNDPKALAAVARGFKELTYEASDIENVSVPTMALIGEIDPMKVQIDALAKVRPAMEVVVIEGANHVNAFLRPNFLASMKRHIQANAISIPLVAGGE